MLGVVFTEFMDMVEASFSADMVDDILDDAKLDSGGAYTAVGEYDHKEMVALVVALSRRSGAPIDDLVQTFGRHLFGRFVERYPGFFEDAHTPFDFLMSVESHIHKEVKKLYPNAELPSIKGQVLDDKTMEVVYSSVRPFSVLAHGLIEGVMQHFRAPCTITSETLSTNPKNQVRFIVQIS